MLRMWMERLTLQGPLPKETLWDCAFCRYDLPRISFKDSPPFFPFSPIVFQALFPSHGESVRTPGRWLRGEQQGSQEKEGCRLGPKQTTTFVLRI